MSLRHLIALPLLLMPLTGCVVAAVGAASVAGVTVAQERSVGTAIDDASISSQIKAKLLRESVGHYGEVDVEVSSGLVLLSGRVNTPEERVKAESFAWSVKGTEDVANEIKIEPPGGFFANVGDEIITARVRTALFTSRKVRSYNFNIETYDGIVYLMGIARSSAELERAAEKASYVGGVKQVVSYVRIREKGTDQPDADLQDVPEDTYQQPYGSDSELRGGS